MVTEVDDLGGGALREAEGDLDGSMATDLDDPLEDEAGQMCCPRLQVRRRGDG
jgi:hypothetical protein